MTEGLNPDMKQPSPWWPTTNRIQLAALGKFIEELSECSAATSRVIIQGMDEVHPSTKKPNRLWLLEELADVQASMEVLMEVFSIDQHELTSRILAKKKHLRGWHELIKNKPSLR